MLRNFTSWLVVLLLLGAVCGFAWLTRHPESPWLEAAEEWPLVGPLAERFRRAYLGPPAGESTAAAETDSGPVVVIVRPPPPDEPIDLTGGARPAAPDRGGGPAAAGPERPARPALAPMLPDLTAAAGESVIAEEARIAETLIPRPQLPVFALPPPASRRAIERTWLLPGTVLRSAPAGGATEIERTSELASVPVLDRRGEWLRVRLRGRDGWADPATPVVEVRKAGFASYYGRHAAQPRTDSLFEAKKALGLSEPNGRLGPFPLYTDVEDEELLALLDRVAERLDEAYGARFGLGLPKRRARPQIALFAEEADYRAVERGTRGARQHMRGFAAGGLVVFYVGNDSWQRVITGIVHELTHTLNRHTLGPSLPPWLEEGLAEDLGGVWIEDPDAPAPAMTHPGNGLQHHWAMQDIVSAVVAMQLEDVPAPNAELLSLDHDGFFGPGMGLHYKRSQLLVRCLLDADDGFADAFRRFLYGTSGGLQPEPKRLAEQLDRDWPEVERVCREHRRGLAAEIARLLPEGLSVGGLQGTAPQRLVDIEAGLPAAER